MDRLPEGEFWGEVERLHPQILGGLLDAAAFGLGHLPIARERLLRLPRLADWAVWVAACSPALGYAEEEIVNAFFDIQTTLDLEILDRDPVAQAILRLVKVTPYVALSLMELFSHLETFTTTPKPEGWPKNPQVLARHLARLAPALRTVGVKVERGEREASGRRMWVIKREE